MPLRFSAPAAALFTGLVLASAHAQPQQPPDRRGPPPEAYQACEGKSAGDAVTLTLPDGHQMAGTCRSLNGTLVAQPAGGPPNARPASDR